jgi:cellulose synthase/poly-beta-1,6-N-acetylglucosamine synthase-like glycosyltransferase
VSSVIPVYGVSFDVLEICIRSVSSSHGCGDNTVVVLDGPQSFSAHDVAMLDPDATVVELQQHRGLVATWNACLSFASRELVHLMHVDDVLDPAFYDHVRRAFHEPSVVMAATLGTAVPQEIASRHRLQDACSVISYSGEASVRLLLSASKPPAGSFVFRRSALAGLSFNCAYPYSPDEELTLRLALIGDVAIIQCPLYFERQSPRQARRISWERPDFVDRYAHSRLDPISSLGPSVAAFALAETRDRVLSICAELVLAGRSLAAVRNAFALVSLDRSPATVWKALGAVLVALAPGGRHMIIARRRWKTRLSSGRLRVGVLGGTVRRGLRR